MTSKSPEFKTTPQQVQTRLIEDRSRKKSLEMRDFPVI